MENSVKRRTRVSRTVPSQASRALGRKRHLRPKCPVVTMVGAHPAHAQAMLFVAGRNLVGCDQRVHRSLSPSRAGAASTIVAASASGSVPLPYAPPIGFASISSLTGQLECSDEDVIVQGRTVGRDTWQRTARYELLGDRRQIESYLMKTGASVRYRVVTRFVSAASDADGALPARLRFSSVVPRRSPCRPC
jgi:hypothetical protein